MGQDALQNRIHLPDHLLRLTIAPEQDGLTIKQFLREKLHFSMHQISRIKYRPEGFLVNGEPKWVTETLHTGDVLCFSLDLPAEDAADCRSFLPPAARSSLSAAAENNNVPALPILFEDAFLLAVNKPQGMVSHPSHGHHGDSALDLMRQYCRRLYLIGRLDKDTSGVLLFAKHMETASLLSKQKDSGTLSKTYLAAVRDIPDPAAGTIDVPIAVAREMPLKMKTDALTGKSAKTHYRVLRTGTDPLGNPAALLSVTIEHGRTHQIRVHLAFAGHPILGDALYGMPDGKQDVSCLNASDSSRAECSVPSGPLYAHLHASKLQFIHPYTGETLTVCAPDPVWAGCDIFR